MRFIIPVIIGLIILSSLGYANSRPVFTTINSKEVSEGQTLTFPVYATDPDGDAVEISALNLPRGATFDGSSFRWTIDFDQDGYHNVRFVATDSHGAQTSITVRITVLNVNHAPRIISVSPDTRANIWMREGIVRVFSINAVDPDDDDLNYEWYLDGVKKRSSDEIFKYTPDYDESGTHAIEVIVSDRDYELREKWNVTVDDNNRRPVFENFRDREIKEGIKLKFYLDASDQDKDTLTFSANYLPPGAGLDPVSGLFTWTPAYKQEGVYRIIFKVTDQKGYSSSQTMKIDVDPSEDLQLKAGAGTIVNNTGFQPRSTPAVPRSTVTRTSTVSSTPQGGYTYNSIQGGNVQENMQVGTVIAAVLVFLIPVFLMFIFKR